MKVDQLAKLRFRKRWHAAAAIVLLYPAVLSISLVSMSIRSEESFPKALMDPYGTDDWMKRLDNLTSALGVITVLSPYTLPVAFGMLLGIVEPIVDPSAGGLVGFSHEELVCAVFWIVLAVLLFLLFLTRWVLYYILTATILTMSSINLLLATLLIVSA